MNKIRNLFLKNKDNSMLLIILVVCTIVVGIAKPSFISTGTLQSICYQIPEMALLTMTMMIAMLSGGIDLSCIASANLAGITMALIMTNNIPKKEDNLAIVLLACLVGILICTLVGVLNGLIIAYFKIPAMLVTLGTQLLLNGISLVATKGATISGYPKSFKFIGNGKIFGFIPTPFTIFIFASLILYVVVKKTPLGTRLFLFGSNNTASDFSGVNDKEVLVKSYALAGFFVGLAAIILTSRFNSAAAGYASTFLMQAILIAVFGGVNPNGGHGRVSGIILGVLIMQIVASGLNILKLSSNLTTALYGVILLLAVAIRSK